MINKIFKTACYLGRKYDLMSFSAEKDMKQLLKINLKHLSQNPPSENEDPKEHYQRLMEEAKSGPTFSSQTLNKIQGLPEAILPKNRKPFVKWLANQMEQEGLRPSQNDIISIKDYLNNVDVQLDKISFDELKTLSDNWHTEKFEINEDAGDYKTKDVVYSFDNGYTIVKVPPEDLGTEGAKMGHCVGEYCDQVEQGSNTIYSLRDPNNQPHVTIELEGQGPSNVVQIKGKENKPPVDKYKPMVREWIKKNFEPSQYINEDYVSIATTEELINLSQDENEYIRLNVSENPNTPPEALFKLSTDDFYIIRLYVAGNPNTPPEALIILSQDENQSVKEEVAENPNTPPEALIKLIMNLSSSSLHEDWVIKINVANNPNAPIEVFIILSQDKRSGVRQFIAGHPNTPPEILIKLSTDEDGFVRRDALNNPNHPQNKKASNNIFNVANYYQQKLAKKKKKKKGKKWKKLPKGWDEKSRSEYYESLVGDTKHPVTKCIKKMKKHIDDPGGYCASLKDREEGKGWRKKKKKSK